MPYSARQRHLLLALAAALLIAAPVAPHGIARGQQDEAPVDFDRQVRPILSDYCFACHGPDAEARQADLRLDVRDEVFAARDGQPVIVAGDSEHSRLWQRLTSADDDERMPPASFGRRPSAEQIELIRRWIDQGAVWQSHWAFQRPQPVQSPEVVQREWIQTPIDAFILQRLEQEGLRPAPRASRETLIRRLSLDLTGLPPTPAEVAAFCQDDAPDAYERLVDRLLVSPAFGERMAVDWLDGARYADTSGYQNDGPRSMWRWRDWVIGAFNRNMPLDQFTIEQIAGDLLPGATLEQQMATGFQRNHRGNAEGGIIPEEFAVEYVVDRVETTSAVWLGLTIGCARCHDHKYDPISQREFYQLYAFFNNIPEHGRAIKEGNSPPFIMAPTEEQQQQLSQFNAALADAEASWQAQQSLIATQQQMWETTMRGSDAAAPIDWAPAEDQVVYFDGTAIAPTQADADAPGSSALSLDGTTFFDAGDTAGFGYFDKFAFSAWIRPDKLDGVILSRMVDVAEGEGYSLMLDDGRLQLNLVKRWLDDSLRVESQGIVTTQRWTHVAACYDGSRNSRGIRLYIDGKEQPLVVNLDLINQSFAVPNEPLRIGGGHGSDSRFAGQIDEVRIYSRTLAPEEIVALAERTSISDILMLPPSNRQEGQSTKLTGYFLERAASPDIRDEYAQLKSLRRQEVAFRESLPTLMVMQERSTPRQTFILTRGQYDQPSEPVEADVPGCLPPLMTTGPANRLDLARWLVAPDHPLTARVLVNRYWQLLMGTGLVKTAEDFGIQGERPSHPELLDWLAIEFVRSGWDLKQLIRQIVLSATYQQSSAAPPELWQRDPENRLLARGPRFRLPAELIRDQVLAASGLLCRELGGPSVRPYQPEGLWSEIATDTKYEQSEGKDLYRRSLYTYWKRTVSPPTMLTFDAPSRETCVIRRPRTNTPLQALALMNEDGYLEAARHLAARSMREGGSAPAERLSYAFELATSRQPSTEELAILQRSLARFRERYAADPAAARQAVSVGQAPCDASHDVDELAAYAAVSSLILNLDEVITKE